MVLISVSCCPTYLGCSVVIYHKKSSDLVIGNLLFRLNTLLVDFSAFTVPLSLVGIMGHVTVCSSKGFTNTLLVDFSAVTEPFSLVGFMGHVTVCSSKGFAKSYLLMGSSFHFKGITVVSLLSFSISLWIWVAICLDSQSLPYLFRCRPCHVKYFLCKLESTIITLL